MAHGFSMPCLVLVALGACNDFYGIETTVVAPPDDVDGDGTRDVEDNCVDVANRDQADYDADEIGDACDNCPILANATQSNVGDTDDVGDDCDPHPVTPGDCLVLVDTFADPTLLASHWRTVGTSTAPNVVAELGAVTIAAGATENVGLLAIDEAGAIIPVSDAHLVGATMLASGEVYVHAVATSLTESFACSLRYASSMNSVYAKIGTGLGGSGHGIQPGIGTDLDLRISTDIVNGVTQWLCTAEYGFALGHSDNDGSGPPAGGGAGFSAFNAELRVRTFAAYRFAPGASCPEVIWR